MRDTIIGTRAETRTYVIVRCANCEFEFQTADWFKTARCHSCGRVCHLDTAVRVPGALPDGVIPIRRTA